MASDANTLCRDGRRLLEQGDVESALETLSRALSVDPRHLQSRQLLAVARHQIGDLNTAIADYTALLQENPDDAWSLQNRGVVRKDAGDDEGARQRPFVESVIERVKDLRQGAGGTE